MAMGQLSVVETVSRPLLQSRLQLAVVPDAVQAEVILCRF